MIFDSSFLPGIFMFGPILKVDYRPGCAVDWLAEAKIGQGSVWVGGLAGL